LISSLKRFEEIGVPSLLDELTRTGTPVADAWPKMLFNIAGVVFASNTNHLCADIDVVAGSLIKAGRVADGGVASTRGIMPERLITERVVEESGCVKLKRLLAHGVVAPAATVASAVSILKRLETDSHICAVLRVSSVGDAAQQCLITDSHVTIAIRVIEERGSAVCRVGRTVGVVLERSNPVGHVGVAGGVAKERQRTAARVVLAGGVVKERSITVSSVVTGGVVIERGVTAGSVVEAFAVVRQRKSAHGIVVPPGGVAVERINASAGVVAAAGIAKQGPKTRRRIALAGSVLIERLETKSAVLHACGQTDQGPAAIGRIGLRLRLLRKRKAD